MRLAVITAWFTAVYIPLIRLIAPDAWRALLQRLVGLYKGRMAEGQPAPTPKSRLPEGRRCDRFDVTIDARHAAQPYYAS